MREVSDREKFLFDVQGFLRVEGFLTVDEVARLNEAIDAKQDLIHDDPNRSTGDSPALAGTKPRQALGGMLTWEQPWCEPFRELLAHPKLVPYLNTFLGPGWKWDHGEAVFLAEPGAEGLVFHGPGQFVLEPALGYFYGAGRIRTGLLSVEFHLVDHEEGEGGFAAIPGSHKANFAPPPDVLRYESDRHIFVNPAARAGDLLIFSEGVVHGTLPWKAPHQRRSILYRYTPRYLHYAGGSTARRRRSGQTS